MKNFFFLITIICTVFLSSCKEKMEPSYKVPNEDKLASSIIDSIFQTPIKYQDESVLVEGTITQYVAATTKSTSYYILKSYYGSFIKVITSAPAPKVNYEYRVEGIVSMQPGGPEIVENSKSCINCDIPIIQKSSLWEKYLPYLLIGLGIILIVIVVLIILLNRKKPEITEPSYISSGSSFESSQSKTVLTQEPELQYDNSYKTIRIPANTDIPSTLKIINVGKLQILSGPDSGRVFNLCGIQTPEGVVLSIGRDTSGWKEYLQNKKQFTPDRLHAHILIKDPTATLSRLQAELIYNNHMFVRHYGSNPTIVNGKEMSPNEKIELPIGSTIQAGEMIFKYIE